MKLRSFVPVALLAYGLAGQTAPSSSPSSPSPLTLLSKEGKRPIAVSVIGDQELVALDDLAAAFQLTVREDSLGAITVSYKGKAIVLTPDQALASVAGKLISLPAPPVRSGRRWLLPLEFISRVLATIYDARMDLRKQAHLLIVGDLRVPRVLMRYELLGTGARLTVDATPRANASVSQENDRLMIKFEADALDVVLPQIQPQGLVQGVRVADPISVAVDLGPRFAAFRATTQPLETSARLTIDIVAATTEPAAPSPTPVPPLTPLPDLGTVEQASVHTVVIDPGHGGEDAGVKGPGGTKEKDLTLAVARRLKASIESRLGIRVLLTRDDDRNIAVDDRAAVANNNKADLFLSLHASASLRLGTAGASVFIAAFDKNAEDQARASLGTERLPTFSGGQRDIELVLWDFAQIRHLDRSAELAEIVEQQLRDHIPLSSRAIDRAPLRVLESANMPAVIIEMGYLTNAGQEKQLMGSEFQNALVQSLVDTIVKFRDRLGAVVQKSADVHGAKAVPQP